MVIPRHINQQSGAFRFNWLFEKKYYGRIFVARLFEAHFLDDGILIDSRRCTSRMYNSSDLHTVMLSSSGPCHSARPGVNKVKIVDLFEVLRYQRKYKTSDEFKQGLLYLPR